MKKFRQELLTVEVVIELIKSVSVHKEILHINNLIKNNTMKKLILLIVIIISSARSTYTKDKIISKAELFFELQYKRNYPYYYIREINKSYIFPLLIEYQDHVGIQIQCNLYFRKKVQFGFKIPYLVKINSYDHNCSFGDIEANFNIKLFKKVFLIPKLGLRIPVTKMDDISKISLSGSDGRLKLLLGAELGIDVFKNTIPFIDFCFIKIYKNYNERKFDTFRKYKYGNNYEIDLGINTRFNCLFNFDSEIGIRYWASNLFEGNKIIDTDELILVLSLNERFKINSNITFYFSELFLYYSSRRYIAPVIKAGCKITI